MIYTPPKAPRTIGGRNPRAIVCAILLGVVMQIIATEGIAAAFRDQPAALGTPLLTLPTGAGVYQPFAWIAWAWKGVLAPDPAVHDPIRRSALLGMIGLGILLIGPFRAGRSGRDARALAGMKDIHGSARWAKEQDIVEAGLLPDSRENGVFIGAWQKGNYKRYLRHSGPEHVLAFAPTRSGKGVGLVIPTLLAWKESAIIYDIKGENFEKTAGWRAEHGFVLRFAPTEETGSSRFNPLSELRLFTNHDVADAQTIAKMLIYQGDDVMQDIDPHWRQSGESFMTGLILHTCYAYKASERVACIADLYNVATVPGQSFRDTLDQMIQYHHSRNPRKWGDGTVSQTHPVVARTAQEMASREEREFSGILSTVVTALSLFKDYIVAANTSASDFTINDLVYHSRPVSLYICIPAGSLTRCRVLVRLIFTLAVSRLTEKMDFSEEESARRHQLLLMIDEFPSLRHMSVIEDSLSFIAGYGIIAFLIAQDTEQIIKQYSVNQTVTSNCPIRIAYVPNNLRTARMLEEMSGDMTVITESPSYSGKRNNATLSNVNASVHATKRPLVTADEISRLRLPKKAGFGRWQKIVEAGDALIFSAGTPPILGTQILYFQDPVLSARAAIEAPAIRYAIENGQEILQRPINRTANVISPVEKLTKPQKQELKKAEEQMTLSLVVQAVAPAPAEQPNEPATTDKILPF